MANEINYDAVIADLEARKAEIEAAIAALRLVAGGSGSTGASAAGAVPSRPVDPFDIPNDAFFGLSIGDAVKKYLTMVKRKQTIKEIADALERGGLPHTSTNFIDTVRAMVNRQARTDLELVRVGPGNWGLSAWYGNRRPKEPAKPKARRKKEGKRPKARQAVASDAPSAAPAKPAAGGLTIVQQAAKILGEMGSLSVESLIEEMDKRFSRKVAKATLVGILAEKVRNDDTFTRPAPNTYGVRTEGTLH